MGYVAYMTFFFCQSFVLLATFAFAWVLYIRLALFLKPDSNANSSDTQDDDEFEDLNKSAFERKRDVIRKNFKPQYLRLNLVLLYLLLVLTIRTVTYFCLRLTSYEKIFEWQIIKPSVFYVTYVTDFMILAGILNFIASSTPLKEKYQTASSIVTDTASINVDLQESEASDGSVDGDALF